MISGDGAPVTERLGLTLGQLPEVRLAFLFGSRVRRRHREDSDFDVGILLDDDAACADRGRVIRRLAGRLGREVSSALIDLVILNDAPVLLRHRVVRDGVLLFESAPEERVRFAIKTIREYQAGQIRRERFTRRRSRRLKANVTNCGSGDLLEKARGVARLLDKTAGGS